MAGLGSVLGEGYTWLYGILLPMPSLHFCLSWVYILPCSSLYSIQYCICPANILPVSLMRYILPLSWLYPASCIYPSSHLVIFYLVSCLNVCTISSFPCSVISPLCPHFTPPSSFHSLLSLPFLSPLLPSFI